MSDWLLANWPLGSGFPVSRAEHKLTIDLKREFFYWRLLTPERRAGLIRASCSRGCRRHAQIAQSVEQWIENPRVGGSIPPLGTIFESDELQKRPKPRVNAGFFVYTLSIIVQLNTPSSSYFGGYFWGYHPQVLWSIPPNELRDGRQWRFQIPKSSS